MRRLYPLLQRLALKDGQLLVEGEPGTGKELVAECIHESGPMPDSPFVVFRKSARTRPRSSRRSCSETEGRRRRHRGGARRNALYRRGGQYPADHPQEGCSRHSSNAERPASRSSRIYASSPERVTTWTATFRSVASGRTSSLPSRRLESNFPRCGGARATSRPLARCFWRCWRQRPGPSAGFHSEPPGARLAGQRARAPRRHRDRAGGRPGSARGRRSAERAESRRFGRRDPRTGVAPSARPAGARSRVRTPLHAASTRPARRPRRARGGSEWNGRHLLLSDGARAKR